MILLIVVLAHLSVGFALAFIVLSHDTERVLNRGDIVKLLIGWLPVCVYIVFLFLFNDNFNKTRELK